MNITEIRNKIYSSEYKFLYDELYQYTDYGIKVVEEFRELIQPFIDKYADEVRLVDFESILESEIEFRIMCKAMDRKIKAIQDRIDNRVDVSDDDYPSQCCKDHDVKFGVCDTCEYTKEWAE